MVTRVYSNECYKDNIHSFTVNDRRTLWIKKFDNGIVKVDAGPAVNIYKFAEIIAGCFHPRSNFKKEILALYNYGKEAEIKGIEINFNDRHILVTKENAFAQRICDEYFEIINKE